jgi:hypothetical protein
MQKGRSDILYQILFIASLALIIYMPLHVFISQSASLLTGGIEVWKSTKDVLVFVASPFLMFLSYKRGLFKDKTFRYIAILGAVYALIHGLFLIFDQNDDTYSALVGSVYNTRLFIYLLLGYLVGTAKNSQKYLKYLLTAIVLIASLVAVFGIAQYFLPNDLLEHVGYSVERGVKPLFYIDDKPNLPRVMSTIKDPNSLGAYLILPILFSWLALFKQSANKLFFIHPFRKHVLAVMLLLQITALFLTFSRGALLGLILSATILLVLTYGKKLVSLVRRHWMMLATILILTSSTLYLFRNTYVFQNLVLHSDESTVLEDPNELRVSLAQRALEGIEEEPFGHGPGSAGLVAINNPKGGVLTENYYLQIAYEVGWLGLAVFITFLSIISYQLSVIAKKNIVATVLLASLVAYLFYSFLIHLWSNEAVALQWWLLTGVILGISLTQQKH